MKPKPVAYPSLVTGIGVLVEQSRHAVARSVNFLMTATYWEVGRRIVEFEQGGKRRAGYGEELLKQLAKDLTERHGRGFSAPNLHRFRQFFLSFPLPEIFSTLSKKSFATEILPPGTGDSSMLALVLRSAPANSSAEWLRFLDALAQHFHHLIALDLNPASELHHSDPATILPP